MTIDEFAETDGNNNVHDDSLHVNLNGDKVLDDDVNPDLIDFVQDDLSSYQLVRDKAPKTITRNRKQMNLPVYALLVAECIKFKTPNSYEEAFNSDHANNQKLAMVDEIRSMHDHGTWVLVPKPDIARTIDCKRLFKLRGPTIN